MQFSSYKFKSLIHKKEIKHTLGSIQHRPLQLYLVWYDQ